MKNPGVTETDLHAWIDGRAPTAPHAELEAWLRAHPQDAERIAHYRLQNAALHGAYDDVLEEPVPEHLSALMRRAPRFRDRVRNAPQHYAAVVAWLALSGMIGGVGGWFLHDWSATPSVGSRAVPSATPSFARQAALAHAVYSPEVRHPVEVGADQEAHLVAWLSKRLGTQLRVPHLGEQGFTLVGGRLLPGQPDDRAPVAHFMYQDGKGQRLTLYVRVNTESSRESAFRFAQEENVGVFYWVDRKLGYALSGEIDKAGLLQIATAVYKQLNP